MVVWIPWSRAHALLLLVASGLACSLGLPGLVALVAVPSFTALLWSMRGAWTSSGRFGLANLVTSLRLIPALILTVGGVALPASVLAGLALSVILLDGVDGWAARRFATASEFGARYDCAVDSFFVLGLAVVLVTREVFGPWLLIAGLWHYAFTLLLALFPTSRTATQRTLWGCTVFIALVSALGAALVLPRSWALPAVLVTMAGQCASFLRSLWELYGPLPRLQTLAASERSATR